MSNMVNQTNSAQEPNHLALALKGNKTEFSELIEPYRRELQVHCYRILGSLSEADDMVYETFRNAWKGLITYQDSTTFRAWLYRIATNACLETLDRQLSQRFLPEDIYTAGDPFAEMNPSDTDIRWLEPFPDHWLVDQADATPEARYSNH